MRLAITKSGFYNADRYCADGRSAKRLLRENQYSILAIDYHLVGQDTGCDLIEWAHSHAVLPSYVGLLERERGLRRQLASRLRHVGFRSVDDITFIKG